MSWNSTAYSQTINIPKETKKEIVKTLVAYPVALKRINILDELLVKANERIVLLEKKVEVKDEVIKKKNEEIGVWSNINGKSEAQNKLLKKQLKNSRLGQLKIVGIGGAILGVILIVK